MRVRVPPNPLAIELLLPKERRVRIEAVAVFGDFAAHERLRARDPSPSCSELEREPDERELRDARLTRPAYEPGPTYCVTHVPSGLRAIDRIRRRRDAVEAARLCSETRFDYSAKDDPGRRDEWNAMVAAIVGVKRGLSNRRATF